MAMTIHQLRIFWAVAQAKSYTKASKMLGLAQPSLSQQISKLEDEVGTKLFNRSSSQIFLTDSGKFLYSKAEVVLASIEETEEGLKQFSGNTRGAIKVGMLSSVARNVLPITMKIFSKKLPNIEINVLEVSPAEAIDLLYARQLNVAVVAADSIAASNVSFSSVDIFSDPYVLAVPKKINIDNANSFKDLKSSDKEVMSSMILFEFGSLYKKRIDNWLKNTLLDLKTIAHTRSYEVALSMVEAGLGVVVLPALTSVVGLNRSYDVNLYKTNLLNRRLVALTPNQFSKTEPSKSFVSSLQEAGKHLKLPEILEAPKLFLTPADSKK